MVVSYSNYFIIVLSFVAQLVTCVYVSDDQLSDNTVSEDGFYLTDSIFERDDEWETVEYVSVEDTLTKTFPITDDLGKVDPWEELNREIHGFNDTFDTYLYRPVAQGYRYIMPNFLDDGITNFFGNLEDVPNSFWSLMQFKFTKAGAGLARFGINTTVGLLGFFDVASRIGIEKHDEDLGQTLGYWGVPSGPYIVVPFYGPSTIRDALSDAVEVFTPGLQEIHPLWHVDDDLVRYSLYVLKYIDIRADLIPFEALIQGDKYIYYREFYLNQRRLMVYDGDPPADFGDEFDDELFDEDFDDSFFDEDLEEDDQSDVQSKASSTQLKVIGKMLFKSYGFHYHETSLLISERNMDVFNRPKQPVSFAHDHYAK